MQDYVYVLMERELHEGTYLRGIFTSSYEAEEAMDKLKSERDYPGICSFWVETQYLNQIIRG